MRKAWRPFACATGAPFRADPFRAGALVVLMAALSLTGVITAYLLKLIVDAGGRGDESDAVSAALTLAAVAGLSMLGNAAITRMLFPLKERTSLLLDQRLIDLVGRAPTIDHLERPDYLGRLDAFRREQHLLASSGYTVASSVTVLVEAAATALLLVNVNPVLLALPLFALPSVWAGGRAERVRQRVAIRTAGDARQAKHLFELTTSPPAGQELRIYGLGPHLLGRHREIWQRVDTAFDSAARRALLRVAAGWVVFMVGYAAAIAVVVREAVAGTATPGDVVLALTLVTLVNDQMAGAVTTITDLARTLAVASSYIWLVDDTHARRPRSSAPAPERLEHGVRLDDVGFRYPQGEHDALAGVSLFLPAGGTVAVVGDNGAGKSTLVKLLCGLYRPTTGAILADDVDLADVDPDDWRARVSAGFQDFVRFELLAQETIGVGDLDHVDDTAAVLDALERAASSDVVDALPAGLATKLGSSFGDGTELSGGQWQKLALARAMMRPAPLLLVLDEPTAALDADAENMLFRRYASATRGVQEGTITLLVSHRFSTVTMADLIVVVDRGRVVESGSHRQLLAAEGLYAELYELQARSYR